MVAEEHVQEQEAVVLQDILVQEVFVFHLAFLIVQANHAEVTDVEVFVEIAKERLLVLEELVNGLVHQVADVLHLALLHQKLAVDFQMLDQMVVEELVVFLEVLVLMDIVVMEADVFTMVKVLHLQAVQVAEVK
jgi:hypothetical protein